MKLKMVTGIGAVPNSTPALNGITNYTTAVVKKEDTPQQNTATAVPPTEAVIKKPSDNRRSNKPIMEKRRRARINNCLNELKTLILDAMKKDPARHSKLEKADILEMTVKHLENLQRQQAAMSQAADPSVVNKFKAGFTECANEVGRFPGLDPMMKRRLLQHLSNCINGVKSDIQNIQPQQPIQPNTVQVRILPSPPSSPEQDHHHQHVAAQQIIPTSNGYYLPNGNGGAIQLLQTKLSNGTIAFVVPQSMPTAPLPMLIPIPTRTSSTGSAASSSSSSYDRRETLSSPNTYYAPPSPANSQIYESMIESPPQQPQSILRAGIKRSHSPGPISLVMKKPYLNTSPDEEKPWRPW